MKSGKLSGKKFLLPIERIGGELDEETIVCLYAEQIQQQWQENVVGFIRAGSLLSEAKKRLPSKTFWKMVYDYCPFGKRMAYILMDIAEDPRLLPANLDLDKPRHVKRVSQLQPSVGMEGSGPSIDSYAAGRHAMRAMYDSMAQIDATRQSMLRDLPLLDAVQAKGSAPLLTKDVPPERRAELASAMANSASRTAAVVERNLSAIDSTVGKLSDWIAQKTAHPKANLASVVEEASQIRNYVKSLPDGKRMAWVHDRIEEGDLTTVAAVVNASPWISGITPKEQETLRGFAQQQFAPRETAQRQALLAIKKTVQQGMATYAGEYAKRLPKIQDDVVSRNLAALRGGLA